MVRMAIPIKNQVFDKIQTAGSITDAEPSKALIKDEIGIHADRFNKILLDLEILGLINVSWITKDTRRIEVARQTEGEAAGDGKVAERDYEASFPGADG